MPPSVRTAIMPQKTVKLADALQTIDVDRDAYANCDATYIPDAQLITRWFNLNPAIYILLKDYAADCVVGYINAMPVTDQLADRIIAGTFDERMIGPGALCSYDRPGLYRLYFCSIALKNSYRHSRALSQLARGFAQRLLLLSKQHVYIRDLLVDAVTPAGARLCESLGMSLLATTDRRSYVYQMQLPPSRDHSTPRFLKELCEVYASDVAKQQ
jgi:hypothetical protein